jgi:uncharacterized protein YcaQ
VTVHELSRVEARRIAVRAQMLDRNRPDGLHDLVRQLTLLQVDLTAHVGPSADLIVWSRLGSSYAPSEMEVALANQTLIELRGMIRPGEDLALYRADMVKWSGLGELRPWEENLRDWVEANNACRLDILDRLRADGPLPARALPDTCDVPWRSTGWNNNRNVIMLLELMGQRGEVAVAGRDGRDRLWDLAERLFPNTRAIPSGKAHRIRDERRLQSLGVARAHAVETQIEPLDVDEVGAAAVIDGVRGTWRVDPAQLGQPFSGRAALLSPLDRLIYDRKRMTELFEFDYQLEMYKPAAKRRWGYWALPILYGDQLVGKVDATADRKAGVLRVDAIHRDVPFTKAMSTAIDREIRDLATWLQLDLNLPGSRTAALRR